MHKSDNSVFDFSQLEGEIKSLNKEVEEANAELKNLKQRDRENQEGEALIALLRSDMELSKNERSVYFRTVHL